MTATTRVSAEHAAGDGDTLGTTPLPNLGDTEQLLTLIRDGTDDSVITRAIAEHIRKILERYSLEAYVPLLLYDERYPISHYHANRIYDGAARGAGQRDILLILHSNGGSIEPAYLISKTCKRLSKERFIVAVPRRAKSAATLLSLGADEIHMGLMSELGPIDPQVGGYPALSLSNALDALAELVSKFQGSGEMFAQYLTKNFDLKDLGYLKRVGESAAQYAERLLVQKPLRQDVTGSALAHHFAQYYKDHGFVIDVDEATGLLGSEVVRTNTPEYNAANEVYQLLDLTGFLLGVFRQSHLVYVGPLESGLTIRRNDGN